MTERPTFKRYEIPGLCERPDWWKVRLDEIDAATDAASLGESCRVATSACGHPVWAVAYGPPRAKAGTGTWGIASNSRNPAAYKTGEGGHQVVVLVCGVHAAEAEATAGAMNLISLMETGRDLRGEVRPELAELCRQYRLVILPSANPDGRAISPDHLRGATDEQFRIASQGQWADGSLVGYPACKEWAPLPLDRVTHPGGYPNGDGYNIMHDCVPGDLRTDEARGILKLVADEQADLILHMHSHTIGGQMLGPSMLGYPLHAARAHAYQRRIHDALDARGLRPGPVHGPGVESGTNLQMATTIASGGLSLVFEQSAAQEWTFDEMLETFYTTVETFLQWGLREPYSPRDLVRRGRLG